MSVPESSINIFKVALYEANNEMKKLNRSHGNNGFYRALIDKWNWIYRLQEYFGHLTSFLEFIDKKNRSPNLYRVISNMINSMAQPSNLSAVQQFEKQMSITNSFIKNLLTTYSKADYDYYLYRQLNTFLNQLTNIFTEMNKICDTKNIYYNLLMMILENIMAKLIQTTRRTDKNQLPQNLVTFASRCQKIIDIINELLDPMLRDTKTYTNDNIMDMIILSNY